MSFVSRIPLKLTIGLALTVAIDTVVQLAWKVGAAALPDLTFSWSLFDAAAHQWTFYVVVGLMLCQLVNWLLVLREADLSFAQPITSISRITVCLASAAVLGERLHILQMIGIGMVCVGAWCISRTIRNTLPQAGTP